MVGDNTLVKRIVAETESLWRQHGLSWGRETERRMHQEVLSAAKVLGGDNMTLQVTRAVRGLEEALGQQLGVKGFVRPGGVKLGPVGGDGFATISGRVNTTLTDPALGGGQVNGASYAVSGQFNPTTGELRNFRSRSLGVAFGVKG